VGLVGSRWFGEDRIGHAGIGGVGGLDFVAQPGEARLGAVDDVIQRLLMVCRQRGDAVEFGLRSRRSGR
jgi:hypothetical protein